MPKKKYILVLHLPMEHEDDDTAREHALLAAQLLQPLKEGTTRASLYDVSETTHRHVEWKS